MKIKIRDISYKRNYVEDVEVVWQQQCAVKKKQSSDLSDESETNH